MTTAVLLRGKGKEKKENLQAREYTFLFSCRPLPLPLENKFIFWFNRDAILHSFIFYLNLVADIFGFYLSRTCTTVSWTFRIFYEKVMLYLQSSAF
jgi:hypothetical protein